MKIMGNHQLGCQFQLIFLKKTNHIYLIVKNTAIHLKIMKFVIVNKE